MWDRIPAALIPVTVVLLTDPFCFFDHWVGGSRCCSGPLGWGQLYSLLGTGHWFQSRDWEVPAGLSPRGLGQWPEPSLSAVSLFLAVPQCSLGNHRGRSIDLWPCCS